MSKRKWSVDDLKEAVRSSFSFRQVIQKLGLNGDGGGSNSLIKRIVAEEGIDISHFTGMGHLKGKSHSWTKSIPLDELLKKGVHTSSSRLKKRLYKAGLLKEECRKCKLGKEWQNEEINLHLEHINGDEADNRIENLEILCPNCHSQTKTYCRRK